MRKAVWFGLAALCLAGVLLVRHASSSSDRAPSVAPAWVSHCLPTPANQRRVGLEPGPVMVSSSDRAYLGLTRDEAYALARQRGQHLSVVAAARHCLISGEVAYLRPVAVAFDTGANRGIPDSARIVFASSDRRATL